MKFFQGIPIYFFVAVTILYSADIKAQAAKTPDEIRLPELVPGSPEAMAMEKFLNFQVGLYTGTPNVSIPVWQVNSGSIQVPISLDYHASGIRVEDVASFVGLGWNLNAGGAITRQMVGKPDEVNGLFSLTPDIDNLNFTNTADQDYIMDAFKGNADTGSDFFNFSAPGLSGKFVFDQNRNLYHIPFQAVKVVPPSSISGQGGNTFWEIVAADGTSYYYGENNAKEVNYAEPNCGSTPQLDSYVTAWMLTKIKSPTGDQVIFEYDAVDKDYYTTRSESRYYVRGNSCDANTSPYQNTDCMVVSNFSGAILKKLSYNGLSVEFVRSTTGRTDMETGPGMLSTIKILEGTNLIKKFDLTYSDVTSTVIQPTTCPLGATAHTRHKHRQFLKTVTEASSTGQTKPSYTLDYYSPALLPARCSFAQDHWGYFNGQNTNVMMVPELFGTNNIGANREAGDIDIQKLGMLQRITYPTGGSDEYLYETHSVYSPHYEYNLVTETKANAQYGSIYASNINSSMFILETDDYQENIEYYINFLREGDDFNPDFNLEAKVKNLTTNQTVHSTTQDSDTGLPNHGMLQMGPYYLQGGFKYEFKTSVNLPESGDIGRVYFTVKYKKNTNLVNYRSVGGVRVKKITKKDSDGTIALERSYEYVTGKLFKNPTNQDYYDELTQFSSKTGSGSSTVGCSIEYTTGSAASKTAYSNSKGNHIAYQYVKEIETGNGRTDHHFTFAWDFNSYSIRTTPITSYDHKRGMPERIEIYDKRGAKQKETIYDYEFNPAFTNSNSYKVINLGIERNVTYNVPFTYNSVVFEKYDVVSEWIHPTQTTETKYAGNDNFSVQQKFHYDNATHGQLTRTEEADSQGNNRITKVYYADDVTSTSALPGEVLSSAEYSALNSLKSSAMHRPGIPVQQEHWIGSTFLSRVRTNFKNWGNNLILPETIESTLGTNSAETRVRYRSYDSKGNPRELSQENGTRIVYLWGYDQTFPVAQIQNATYEDVSSVITQSILNNPASDAALRTELNKLRTATSLKGALVTTMTYDPAIGMTSQTTPNGLTTTYEYDNFNRLKYVKDKDGNILRKMEYTYKVNANTTNN